MSQTINCEVCGGENDAGAVFCKFCGASFGQVAAVQQAAAVEEPPTATCPNCGATVNAGQKFCGTCGGMLDSSTPAAAPAAPAVALGGTTLVGVAGAIPSAPAQNTMANATAKLDSFMGATVDLDAVGRDFDPNSVVLGAFSPAEVASAFQYFGKTMASSEPTPGPVPEKMDSRNEAKEVEDKASREKAKRDFSAQAGTMVFGALSSQLQTEFAPKVEMIVEQRSQAATKEKNDRLKHKVALGDMDKRTAVQQAEE